MDYQALVEHHPEPILVHNAGVIRYANPAAAYLMGVGVPAALVGRTLLSYVQPLDSEIVRLQMLDKLARNRLEASLINMHGEVINIEIKAVPVRFEGEAATLITLRDITPLKEAEERLHRVIDDLDAFAHTVAHDIKNPLALIVGLASYISQEYPGIDEETMNEISHAMVKHGYVLTNLVDELLLLSQVRQAEVVLHAVDMGQVVESALEQLAHQIEAHEASVTCPDEWPQVWGYSTWVREVWINYLSNALKYGGEPPVVEAGYEDLQDGTIRFWVSDQGPGLSQAEQLELFQPFAQMSQAQTKGHGLGLSIVKRIVDRLNGQVGVESAPGKGARFWFTLPTLAEE